MGGAVFTPRWLFGLRHIHMGAYSLFGGAGCLCEWFKQNVCLQQKFMQMNTPQYVHPSFYDPRESHSCPPLSHETIQDKQVGLSQAPMELLLLP